MTGRKRNKDASPPSSPDGASELPEGWRKEWRPPKSRTPGLSRARADEPLPEPSEMRQRAIRVLLDVAEDDEANPTARVGAAGRIVDLTEPLMPEIAFLRMFDNDVEAAQRWIAEHHERIVKHLEAVGGTKQLEAGHDRRGVQGEAASGLGATEASIEGPERR